MRLMRSLQCLLQHYWLLGVRVVSHDPLTIEGPRDAVDGFSLVVDWVRPWACQLGQDHRNSLMNAEHCLSGYVFTEHERNLIRSVGDYVWTGDQVFVFGRLEGVVPGIAWVSPRVRPTLPACQVSRFRERMRHALPFSSCIVEMATQVNSEEIGVTA
jgi:hypothetical protein